MKRSTLLLCLFVLAILSGCDAANFFQDPQCYDLAPGRRLTRAELSDLEEALDDRLFFKDFDNDVSFDNPIGPGRCYGEWNYEDEEWEIDCEEDNVVVNCRDND